MSSTESEQLPPPLKKRRIEKSAAHALLEETKLYDVVTNRDSLVILTPELTLQQAMQKLSSSGILSAPVVTEEKNEDGSTKPKFLGLVDTEGILRALIEAVIEREVLKDVSDKPKEESISHAVQVWKSLTEIGEQFKMKSITDYCGSSDVHLMLSAQLDMTLSHLITKGFLNYERSISTSPTHRAVIFSPEGEVVGVISQSDIVRFLSKHHDCLSPLKNRSLEQLGLLGEVLTVSAGELAINAFADMYNRQITGLGVIDGTGRLVGNLSASDLKGLQWFDFIPLTLSITEFLTTAKARIAAQECHSMKMKAVTLLPSSTFEELLSLFVTSRMHRIYIVNPVSGVPVGVVTLTDVLSILAIHCQLDSPDSKLESVDDEEQEEREGDS